MARYCSNCGRELKDGEVICPACGTHYGTLDNEPAPSASPSSPGTLMQTANPSPSSNTGNSQSSNVDEAFTHKSKRPRIYALVIIIIALVLVICVAVVINFVTEPQADIDAAVEEEMTGSSPITAVDNFFTAISEFDLEGALDCLEPEEKARYEEAIDKLNLSTEPLGKILEALSEDTDLTGPLSLIYPLINDLLGSDPSLSITVEDPKIIEETEDSATVSCILHCTITLNNTTSVNDISCQMALVNEDG
ncbi:MAG: zinc ribbon domain-containing protein, partial [Eggerthellaceae bacterium]|nr:zinc ribbon domain-containing protein [Eggerthellaceae bacterium]